MAELNKEKIVDFCEYCGCCIHEKCDEHEDPCDECLSNPVNIWSHKPVKFIEKK